MKKIKNYIKKNKKNIILLISSILFILITYWIFSAKINHIDTEVHLQILNIRNDKLTNILLTITNISSAYALIVLSIILIFIIKNKKIPLYISLNLLLSFLTNIIAKNIFLRPRPEGINLIEESGFSYPSGHAMVSMAYFGFIIYILYKNQKNKLIKTLLIILLTIIILLIGFSRIYLGVHYLSDIIGGFLLSTVYLITFIKSIPIEKVVKK